MSECERQPAAPKPPSGPRFQFTLGTLLLLFVVLASSLAVFGAWGIAYFAIAVALAAYFRKAESFWALGNLAFMALCYAICSWWPIEPPRIAARRAACTNNLKQVALGLCDYESSNGHFPPEFTTDKSGMPLHSWRTLILPYIEQGPLFNSLNLSQRWDSSQNKVRLDSELLQYVCPSDPSAPNPGVPGTSYVAVVGQNTAWTGATPRKRADFAGKESQTILVVEVTDSGIQWAEPCDLLLDALPPTEPQPNGISLSSAHRLREDFFHVYDRRAGVNVAMVDGSVRFLFTEGLSGEELRKKFKIGGCKETDWAKIYDDHARRRLNWPNIAALAVWLLSVGALLTQAVRGRKRQPAAKP